jgi:hypothetical protein
MLYQLSYSREVSGSDTTARGSWERAGDVHPGCRRGGASHAGSTAIDWRGPDARGLL